MASAASDANEATAAHAFTAVSAAVETVETTEKPLCVFVGGYAASDGTYAKVWRMVKDLGFDLVDITPRLLHYRVAERGFGLTSTKEIVRQAVDAYAAATKGSRTGPVVLLGHSMGGNICRRMLSDARVAPARTVLLNPMLAVHPGTILLYYIVRRFAWALPAMPVAIAQGGALYVNSPPYAPWVYQALALDMVGELLAGFPPAAVGLPEMCVIQCSGDQLTRAITSESALAPLLSGIKLRSSVILDLGFHEPFAFVEFYYAFREAMALPVAQGGISVAKG